MTRIHIARDRQPLGNFSPHEVADGLKSGRFLPTDLAWQEPMETWRPLAEFTDLPEADDDVELLPPPPVPLEEVSPPPKVTELAWERRQTIGFLPALSETVKQVLSEPSATFRAMQKTGGFGSPLLFYVVLVTVGTWVALLCEIITIKIAPDKMVNSFGPQVTPAMMISYRVTAMVMAPLFVALGAFVTSGIIHLVLMGLCGTEKTYEATFRAYCYAAGAASVFLLIPICGSLIYLVLSLVLLVIAMREVHATTTGKATIGVLLPVFTCCGLMLGGWMVVIALGMAQGVIK